MRGSREQKVKDMIYEAASQAHIHLNPVKSHSTNQGQLTSTLIRSVHIHLNQVRSHPP